MTTTSLRRKIKKAIDSIPAGRLESLADYVDFLNRRPLIERIETARKAVAAGKGASWRKVRKDV